MAEGGDWSSKYGGGSAAAPPRRPPVYLDYNATAPCSPEVLRVMLPYFRDVFGHPSSAHSYGKQPAEAVVAARASVASLLGCSPSEVVFTSGATESNNWALRGAARAARSAAPGRKRILISGVEHPAVTAVVDDLAAKEGFTVTRVGVTREGILDLDAFTRALESEPETVALVSVMCALA